MKNRKAQFSVCIDANNLERLRGLASQRDQTVSHLFDIAVDEFLSRQPISEKETAASPVTTDENSLITPEGIKKVLMAVEALDKAIPLKLLFQLFWTQI